ncbi:uncharacterized protein DSM5745_08733 [Aspergillus mulundensis]|uniref:DUF7770 domain-containing protein n=1 Tax=Aspergillus mulundensis TaxID=1810919 RepID=A0A3D8R4I6_9EURO|nr:Uncharacterized protein DSM5745_08733 [Aspergillus mulundensis]RDW68973.1 Uncharacterized protein DSM5745_08733 [Aspergillus mulundensis]
MSPFRPVHFIPQSRKEQILSLRIDRIVTGPHAQDAGTNHWCFYLAVSKSPAASTRWIKIDCLPSYVEPSTILPGGSKANLIISELEPSTMPDIEPTFTLDLPSGSNITVNDIHDLLVDNGRHKYEFDSQGVGCRFWVTEQLGLFYEHAILGDKAQVEAVKAAIKRLWPEQTALELDRGAYYE